MRNLSEVKLSLKAISCLKVELGIHAIVLENRYSYLVVLHINFKKLLNNQKIIMNLLIQHLLHNRMSKKVNLQI